MPSRATITKFLIAIAFLVVAVHVARRETGPVDAPTRAPHESTRALEGGETAILSAFEQRRSDLWVEAYGTVERVLPDDTHGSRHQRFILRLPSGHTVLVSHNIDLAERVATIDRGDAVTFRGEYEWNERGGVIHWTHHDPRGKRRGGWLEHDGRRYE